MSVESTVCLIKAATLSDFCFVLCTVYKFSYLFTNLLNIILIFNRIFVVLSQRHCETSPSSSVDCWTVQNGHQPSEQANQLGPPVRYYCPHPPSPFSITQPKSWGYIFHHSTEDRRLSQPRPFSKLLQPLPKSVYCSGFHNKHTSAHSGIQWSHPSQSGMLPLWRVPEGIRLVKETDQSFTTSLVTHH